MRNNALAHILQILVTAALFMSALDPFSTLGFTVYLLWVLLMVLIGFLGLVCSPGEMKVHALRMHENGIRLLGRFSYNMYDFLQNILALVLLVEYTTINPLLWLIVVSYALSLAMEIYWTRMEKVVS